MQKRLTPACGLAESQPAGLAAGIIVRRADTAGNATGQMPFAVADSHGQTGAEKIILAQSLDAGIHRFPQALYPRESALRAVRTYNP